MTRATLLHVLERPTALGPAEVRELEQLALAFPYCQTAHLLLAKAAHDQGTMLAGQRLRRAATYAADRTLLRRLIEQVEPVAAPAPAAIAAPLENVAAVQPPGPVVVIPTVAEAVAVPEPAPAPAAEAPPTVALAAVPTPAEAPETAPALPAQEPITAAPSQAAPPAPAEAAAPAPLVQPEPVAAAVPAALAPAPQPPFESAPVETAALLPLPQPEVQAEVAVAPEETIAEAPQAPEVPVEAIQAEIAAPPPEAALPAEAAQLLETEAGLPAEPAQPPQAELPVLVDQEAVAVPQGIALPLADALPIPGFEAVAEAPSVKEEDLLPAQAPAIRPPVEAGAARFEFGLTEAPPAAKPTYELPGLIDEWAASAVTRSLGGPELPLGPQPAEVPAVFTPAAFTGDATVGYGYGESSRLGLSMQLLDLLTSQAEALEAQSAVVAAAQPPAGALPPPGTFFEPDPLLLAHWATHCPPPPAVPSTLDLINNFLRRQPRLTRPAMLPPSPSTQADLSVRSTRVEPELVSENLARIFVRQGKTARAIEIYEKLMVKQPEKMAYFTAQIQSLQPLA